MRRPWTDEELGFIQNPPRGWSARQIGEFIDRSRDSVLVKRGQLRRGWTRQREIITDELLEYVRDNPHRKAQQLADELNWSASAVYRHIDSKDSLVEQAALALVQNVVIPERSSASWD